MKQYLTIRETGRLRPLRAVFVALCLLAVGLPASAQPRPPGQTQADRVVEAHQQVASAIIEARYAPYYTYREETEFLATSYRVVFDRASGRLRVDRPGYTLISDGTDIFLTADDLPGRHLRVPLNGPLTYKRLVEVFPDLQNPLAPALILLLADEPMADLSAGTTTQATSFVPKHHDGKRLHLRLAMQIGEARLAVDGQSRLIDQMLIEVDPQMLPQNVEAVRFHYGFEWSGLNKPVDDKAFELDLKQSHEFTELAQFLTPPHVVAGGGPGGPGGAPAGGQGPGGAAANPPAGNTLIGMPLPDIELPVLGGDKKVKLSDLDEGVFVLEFFASWSKTSAIDLPALADYQAWCDKEGHAVKVFTVAVGGEAEPMTEWLGALEKAAKKDIGMPMLLDTSTDAAIALRLPTVPRTLICVDGRIAEVYGGVKPTFLDDLKKNTPGWLKKVRSEPGPELEPEPELDPEPNPEPGAEAGEAD